MIDLTSFTDSELSAFAKLIHEARFPEVENDHWIWKAPFAVDLHSAVFAEKRRRMELRGDRKRIDRLDDWSKWCGRPEEPIVLNRFQNDAELRAQAEEEGDDFLRWLLRPFSLSENDLERLKELISKLE